MDRAQGEAAGQGDPKASVDICICTYRRESLAQSLVSIADQTGLDGRKVRVIVADNDEHPTAESSIRRMGEAVGLTLVYRHAPARNISIARNACLDAASADWIACIDDDEVAGSRWLACMLAEAEQGGWDAVLGPVKAVYPPDAPGWMRSGDFHSTRPVVLNGSIETGYSGNALMRRALIERAGLRFDPRFGRTGGEDVDFFYRLRDAGGRIGFAPDAWVEEPVSDARARLGWLVVRTFRSGQTYGTRLARTRPGPTNRAWQACLATVKAVACGSAALATLAKPTTRNRFITRGALHLGVLARLVGLTEIETY
jgi:succinoglycan biosynthesis protein ExoM